MNKLPRAYALTLLLFFIVACEGQKDDLIYTPADIDESTRVHVINNTQSGIKEKIVETVDELEIIAKLEKFMLQAAFYDFDDGMSISYDLSVFVVSKPIQYKGKELQVQHYQTPVLGTPWRSEGKELVLLLDEVLLIEGGLHADARSIKIIREVN